MAIKKRKANFSEEEIMQILTANFNVSYSDKEQYADRYDKAFNYYAGIEPIDTNDTGVDPIPVIREIVDENFQILQGFFNGSTSSSVIVKSANIKSTLAEAISRELNTVARNLNNIDRKMENFIKECLLTGQSHMKISMEEKVLDERTFNFEDRKQEDLDALEKELSNRGFNDISVKIKDTKTKRTSKEERETASKMGAIVEKSYKVFTGTITAIARVIFPAVDYVPFKEVFIHPQTQYSLDESPYVCHQYMFTINDGLMNGWDEDVMKAGVSINTDNDSSFDNTGLIIGQKVDPFNQSTDGLATNCAQDVFPVYEHYWKGVYNGSIPKLWHFVCTKTQMLQDPEEVSEMPFVSARIHEIPNSFYGMGIYDTAKHLQDSATRESRMLTYSAANNTFGRFWALKDAYDPESLLTPRAGGVVEVDVANAVGVLPTADVSQALNLLMNETNNRITAQMKSSGSIGEATEKYGEMAGVALSMLIDKTEQGTKSRAATFSSTGLVPLYKKLYRLLQKIEHPIQELVGGYSMADFPKEIGLIFDVSTTTDKQQTAQNVLTAFAQAQQLNGGQLPEWINAENQYSAFSHFISAGTGNEDVSSYLTDPKTIKPSPVEEYMKGCQLKAQAEMYKAEAEGARLSNGKLLSEIEVNNSHASYYAAQMMQLKEQDKQSGRMFELDEQNKALLNKSLAMDVILKEQEFETNPIKLGMDAAQINSQITAEQSNIISDNYATGSQVQIND